MNLPKMFVNSIPKSGTHLLLQILLGIPGAKEGNGILMDNVTDIYKMQLGDVSHGHLYYTKDIIELLNTENIRRVFIYRDPRDVTISMIYYTFISDSTFLHEYFKRVPETFDKRIMTIINGIKNLQPKIAEMLLHGHHDYPNINEFYNDFIGWTQDSNTLSIRYEDIINGELRHNTLHRILEFLWEDISGLSIEKEKIVEMMEKNINPKKSPTFREGKTGRWKNHFTEYHKLSFKRVAGELLIKLGYETDFNW